MGTCVATGEAAGLAAALCRKNNIDDTRSLDVKLLRQTILANGGILEGVA